MRGVLLALVLLFGFVGSFIWTVGSIDPAPRADWVVTSGTVSKTKINSTGKSGRVWTINLVDDPDRFALTHMEKIPELEQRLVSQVQIGSDVAIQTVPRNQARISSSPSTIPISILVLQVGDTVLYDRDDYIGSTNQMIRYVGRGVAIFAWLVSLGLFILALRLGRR